MNPKMVGRTPDPGILMNYERSAAQMVFAKIEMCNCCSFSPREKVRMGMF
jgi:hypothetical protein